MGNRQGQWGITFRECPRCADHRWVRDAACRGMTDLFFPAEEAEGRRGRGPARRGGAAQAAEREAKALCRTCPVQRECGVCGADESDGVWGGRTATERQRARRRGEQVA